MKSVLQAVKKSTWLLSLPVIMGVVFSSCNNYRQVAYFQDVEDTVMSNIKTVTNTRFVEPRVNSGDILNIEVTTIDANITGVKQQEQTSGENTTSKVSGYMVDKGGYVEVPVLGRLSVAGKTTSEIKDVVRSEALKYYKSPMVNVRIANFYITVLGQVNAPGRYRVETEKINVVDAIGLAGDLAMGGKRGNVMVIREKDGQSVFSRVNLNSTDVFQSEYFYLQSGDKIYVEPLKSVAKVGTSDRNADRILSITLGLIGLATSLTLLFVRLEDRR